MANALPPGIDHLRQVIRVTEGMQNAADTATIQHTARNLFAQHAKVTLPPPAQARNRPIPMKTTGGPTRGPKLKLK